MDDAVIVQHLMDVSARVAAASNAASAAHKRLDSFEGHWKDVLEKLDLVLEFMHQTKARAAVWAMIFAAVGGVVGAVITGVLLHFMTK